MSRNESVAVVETFLNCLASKELDRLPIDPDLTIESPMIPRRVIATRSSTRLTPRRRPERRMEVMCRRG